MLENEVLVENEELIENEEVISLDKILEEDEATEVVLEEKPKEDENVKNNSFSKSILIGAVDQIVVFAGALAIQLLFALLLRLFGYHIVEQDKIFIIVYLLINIVYAPICKALKFEKTIGTKVVLKK
ncbi:MAG: hypothetical protein ACRC68_07865 [Clostridium sp.]